MLLLGISAVICIVLGMGMPTSGVYVLLAALVAPSLVEAGIDQIAAHLFILYFGMMSMITPPVALAAFAAATITRDDPLGTGLAAMRVGWAAFILPFVFVATPEILMQGGWAGIALNLGLALIGVGAVTAGIVGFWGNRLSMVLRLGLVALGIVTLPLGFLPGAAAWHIPAALAVVALAVVLRLRARAGEKTNQGRRTT
ncbi:hypothetical protein KU6B_25110 [Mameliella alba]|uniref:TRAP transporter large permease subunit n=1 Tax=Mameliella alba TaxID=561184 RepID=UPI0013E5026F|nr:TRAP transporter large permease subunit [Mameliella alba]BBU56246.1 hypothetical protein KU6B_25110 [Mameliella alba]